MNFGSLISWFGSLIGFECLHHLFKQFGFVIFLEFVAFAEATNVII